MSVIFRRLALGGGGAKGILHVGALQELSKRQPLDFPKGVYGSSIGSILATYIAFGLPIDNTVPLLKNIWFSRRSLQNQILRKWQNLYQRKECMIWIHLKNY